MTRYLVSLPERVVRSAAALAGGLIRELGDVTVPAAVRRTKSYQMMVDIALRFMIEQVGQVEGVYPSEGQLANNFLLRRTAGHGIELAGLLAFRASPVWIMAALADISGAGRQIVQEISDALKEEGLLDRDAKFENIDQLLDGLEQTSGRAADLFNAPPMDVEGLRKEWAGFRQEHREDPAAQLAFGGTGPAPLGRTEAGSRGAEPVGFPAFVDHSGVGDCTDAGDIVKAGSRGEPRRLAHRSAFCRQRARTLQPHPA